jgi:uncharacterized protein YuzE
MNFTYDPKYNIAYIKFREKTDNVETIKISDELNIDISSDGKVYGIELLNANEQLLSEDNKKYFVLDFLNKERIELPVN